MKVANFPWCFKVFVEKESYDVTEEVRGTVYLLLEKPYYIEKISIQFTGKQKCRWNNGAILTSYTDSESAHVLKSTANGRTLVNILKDLKIVKAELNPGNYSFPFTIKLSNSLSSTFEYANLFASSSIHYNLKSLLLLKDMLSIKDSAPVHIRELALRKSNREMRELVTQMSFLGIISLGQSSMRAWIDDTIIYTGYPLTINISIDNSNSKLAIQEISCEVWREIRLYDNNSQNVRFKERVFEIKSEGVPARNALLSKKDLAVRLEPELCDDCFRVTPTVVAGMIACEYELVVTARINMNLLCRSAQPSITFPLRVYNPRNNYQPKPFFTIGREFYTSEECWIDLNNF